MNSTTALASPLVAGLALVAGLVGAVGARFGLISSLPGFALFAFLLPLGAALALLLGLIGLFRTRPRDRRGGAAQAWASVLLSGLLLGSLFLLSLGATQAPPIHDITTNPDDPPAFEAAASLDSRGAGFAYPSGGDQVPDLQRRAYPDLGTARLDTAVDEAIWRVQHAAEDLGWTPMREDAQSGLFEFSDTTPWFRFVDYIAVRVRAEPGGAAVDVRSVSRVGVGDLGKNADRIGSFLDLLGAGD
ncbi:MAG: DUF1499 domain-containing protein [Acidobacteria bacterium]|nr:DUF1499 domain-containing protein [Acidobacteriota bacterium]